MDPYALCAAERVARVLTDHPSLKLCVPHLGADEFDAYARLLERHDTLWLDTTMTVGGYFPVPLPRQALEVRPERILYGTDFPNIPYAWDRELKALTGLKLAEDALAGVLGGNTLRLYGDLAGGWMLKRNATPSAMEGAFPSSPHRIAVPKQTPPSQRPHTHVPHPGRR